MAAKKIIQEWLLAANKDLTIAREDIGKPERREDVGFHCQQSAEKFLKAFIISKNLEFRPTHDLETLLRICLQQNKEFESIKTACKMLSPFYIRTRYPGFEEKLTSKEIKELLGYAETIAKFVRKFVRTKVKLG